MHSENTNLGNDPGGVNQFFGDEEHAATSTTDSISRCLTAFTRLPFSDTFNDILDHFMFPEIVNDTIRHGEYYIVLFDGHFVHDSVCNRGIRTVGAQLAWAIEPVPLLAGFVNNALISRSYDQTL